MVICLEMQKKQSYLSVVLQIFDSVLGRPPYLIDFVQVDVEGSDPDDVVADHRLVLVVGVEHEVGSALNRVVVALDVDAAALDAVVIADDDRVDVFQEVLLDPFYQFLESPHALHQGPFGDSAPGEVEVQIPAGAHVDRQHFLVYDVFGDADSLV